jgi:Zn-dependent alcohol dehydrogenase
MSTPDFSTLVARHRTYFRTGATRSAQWREGQLTALRAMMTDRAEDFHAALSRGQRVQGFVEGNAVPDVFIPQMIDVYTQGLFPFDQLIRFYCFDEINEAVADLQHGKTIKAVLVTGPA